MPRPLNGHKTGDWPWKLKNVQSSYRGTCTQLFMYIYILFPIIIGFLYFGSYLITGSFTTIFSFIWAIEKFSPYTCMTKVELEMELTTVRRTTALDRLTEDSSTSANNTTKTYWDFIEMWQKTRNAKRLTASHVLIYCQRGFSQV